MKLPPLLQRELDAYKVPWQLVSGSRHVKILLGSKLVGVCPHKTNDAGGRGSMNVRSQIRRAARDFLQNMPARSSRNPSQPAR